jgi:hypothetical protein
MKLRSLVKDLPRPPIKEYIFALTRENGVAIEPKMASSAHTF